MLRVSIHRYLQWAIEANEKMLDLTKKHIYKSDNRVEFVTWLLVGTVYNLNKIKETERDKHVLSLIFRLSQTMKRLNRIKDYECADVCNDVVVYLSYYYKCLRGYRRSSKIKTI